jgi:hypothetical protein
MNDPYTHLVPDPVTLGAPLGGKGVGASEFIGLRGRLAMPTVLDVHVVRVGEALRQCRYCYRSVRRSRGARVFNVRVVRVSHLFLFPLFSATVKDALLR